MRIREILSIENFKEGSLDAKVSLLWRGMREEKIGDVTGVLKLERTRVLEILVNIWLTLYEAII